MNAKISFSDTNIEPKFELSDNPAHEISVDDAVKLCGFDFIPELDSRPLKRIRALRDFGDVKKGDLGGYIQDSSLLDHAGECWIYDNACVLAERQRPIPMRRKTNLTSEQTERPASKQNKAFLTGDARLYDHVLFSSGIIEGKTVVRGSVYCTAVRLSGRTKIHKKRIPYCLRGVIHNNNGNETAIHYLSDAQQKDSWHKSVAATEGWESFRARGTQLFKSVLGMN